MVNDCLFHKANYAPALLKRGSIKYDMKEYNYAIKDISDGLKENKDTTFDKEVYRTRAKAYFEVGNFKASIQDYTKIIERFPKDEDALTYRGGAKINVNDNSGSVDDCTKALEINKKSFVAYNFRGTAKGGLKQYVEGLKDLDMALKLKFDYHPAYVNRAAIKMASYCPSLNFVIRVGILPLKSLNLTSGRKASNCDFLLAEDVPTVEFFLKLNFFF